MQNGVLVLGDTVTAVTELAPARLAGRLGQAPSTETTAVVPFYLSDQTTTGLPADANATMTTDPKSLRAYYLEQTYGDISFQTTVFAPVHLTQPKPVAPDDCTDFIDDWADEAESLNPTLDPAQYKHIVYVFPALASNVCGWSGIAEVGGSHVWINGQFNGARDRARARSQPRHHACGRALVQVGGRGRSDGRHVHRRPGALRAAAVRGSLRRDGQPAGAAADEHAAQARARRPPGVGDRDDQHDGDLHPRADGDTDRSEWSCCASPSPAAASTRWSTGARSASSTARRARP